MTAVTRSRRFRDRTPLQQRIWRVPWRRLGQPTRLTDGQAPPGVDVPDRYRAIVTSATGRVLTREQMIDVLTGAGYSESSANERMTSSHPLFQRVGRDRYRVIESPTTKGAPICGADR